MSMDSCLFFHTCAACGVLLRPKAGDCCVFCSFGSVPCPPVQLAAADDRCCAPDSPSEADAEIRS